MVHRARAAEPGRTADLLAAVGRQRRRRDGLPDRGPRARRHQAAVPGRHRRGEQRDRERDRTGRCGQRGGRAGPAARWPGSCRSTAARSRPPAPTTGSACRSAPPTCAKPPRSCARRCCADAQDLYAAENASLSGYQRPGDRACRSSASPLAAGLRRRLRAVPGVTLAARRAPTACSTWACSPPARLVVLSSLAWLALAFPARRSDLLDAQARGLATVEAAAQVGIAAQEAHADESLTLIDNTGDDGYQADYLAKQKALGPGTGHAADRRVTAAAGHPGRARRSRRRSPTRRRWFAAHAEAPVARRQRAAHGGRRVRPRHRDRGDAGAAFTRLSGDLTTAINSDQAVFNSTARSAAERLHRTRGGPVAGRPCSWPPPARGAWAAAWPSTTNQEARGMNRFLPPADRAGPAGPHPPEGRGRGCGRACGPPRSRSPR